MRRQVRPEVASRFLISCAYLAETRFCQTSPLVYRASSCWNSVTPLECTWHWPRVICIWWSSLVVSKIRWTLVSRVAVYCCLPQVSHQSCCLFWWCDDTFRFGSVRFKSTPPASRKYFKPAIFTCEALTDVRCFIREILIISSHRWMVIMHFLLKKSNR